MPLYRAVTTHELTDAIDDGGLFISVMALIKPQLATLKRQAPEGKGWLHEIKLDGYRIQGHLVEGRPAVITRNGHDWKHRMPALTEALARIPANHLVVDREIIVPDSQGRSDHDALKEVLGAGRQSHRLIYYLFDLLHLDRFDLRAAPLIDRSACSRNSSAMSASRSSTAITSTRRGRSRTSTPARSGSKA